MRELNSSSFIFDVLPGCRYFGFVITKISSMEILTKRSFISNVISLLFSFNLWFIMSFALFTELETIGA